MLFFLTFYLSKNPEKTYHIFHKNIKQVSTVFIIDKNIFLFLGTKSMNKSSLNANVDQHFCMISERSCETDGVMKIAITGFKYKTVLLFL